MYLIFKILLAWGLLIVSACSKQASSLAGSSTMGMASISADDWSNQLVFPRTILSKELVFKVTTSSGTPISGVKVNFHLVDVTELKERTRENIALLVEQKKLSASGTAGESESIDEILKESMVGRVMTNSDVTDSAGNVRAKIMSPNSSGKAIAVVATVFDKDLSLPSTGSLGVSGMGFALYTTEFSVNEKAKGLGGVRATLRIDNEQNSNDVKSGRAFLVVLQVMLGDAPLAVSEKLRIRMNSTAPASPWKKNVLPEGEFDCPFVDGKCIVPGAPFYASGRGKVVMVAEDVDNKLTSATREFDLVESSPKYIAVSGSEQNMITPCSTDLDIDRLDLSACHLEFNSDDLARTLYSFILDEGGAPLLKKPVNWQVTGQATLNSSSSGTDRAVFNIQTAGKGMIKLAADNFAATYTYQINPGLPFAVQVTSENAGIENVTTAFRTRIKVSDKQNNLCTNYTSPLPLEFHLNNAPASPNGALPEITFSENVTLLDGVALTQGTLQAKLATTEIGATAPIIRVVMGSSEFLSPPLVVRPGAASSAVLRSMASNSGTALDPSAVVTMKSGDKYFAYVAGYDAFGNYVGDLNATYTPSFSSPSDFTYIDNGSTETIPANSNLCVTIPSMPCPMIGNSGNSTLVSPYGGLVGSGSFQAIPQLIPSLTLSSPTFAFVSDRAEKLVLETQNRTGGINVETAGVPFSAKIIAKDIFGITVASFSGPKTLAVTPIILKNSWQNNTPSIPTGVLSCTFVGGECPQSGWVLADVREPTILNFEESTIPSTPSQFIQVRAGSPHEVVIVETDPNTTPLNALKAVRDLTDPEDPTKPYLPTMTADLDYASRRITYAILVDSKGNPVPQTPNGTDYGAAAQDVEWSSLTQLNRPYPENFAGTTGYFTDFITTVGGGAALRKGRFSEFLPRRTSADGNNNYTGIESSFQTETNVILKASKDSLIPDHRIIRVVPGNSSKVAITKRSLDTLANQALQADPISKRPVFSNSPVDENAFKAGRCFGMTMQVTDSYDNVTTGYTGITSAQLILRNANIYSQFKRNGLEQIFSDNYAPKSSRKWAEHLSGPVVYRHLFGSNFYAFKPVAATGSVPEQSGLAIPDWQLIPASTFDALDSDRTAIGGKTLVSIVNGRILFGEDTPDEADGIAVCLAEITPAADKKVIVEVSLASYVDSGNNKTWSTATGTSSPVNVVQGDFHSYGTAMVTNSAFDGGFKAGTNTAAWSASSPSDWTIDPQGMIGRSEYWAGLYPLMPDYFSLKARTDNWLNLYQEVLRPILPVETDVDYRNGRTIIASVKVDRAGNILKDGAGIVEFAANQTSVVSSVGTHLGKPEGFNFEIGSLPAGGMQIIELSHAMGAGHRATGLGGNVIRTSAGRPYNFIAGVWDSAIDSDYYRNSVTNPSNTFLNSRTFAGSTSARIWFGFKDQFGNLISGTVNPVAKVRFRWEKDNPTNSATTDWNADPQTTYHEDRAKARRSAIGDPSSLSALPSDFEPTTSQRSPYLGKYYSSAYGWMWNFINSDTSDSIWPLVTKRSHCINYRNSNENCYTDNIVVSVENAGAGWPNLPATLENTSFTIPLRVYPREREYTVLCTTPNCKSTLTPAVTAGTSILTPPTFSSTAFNTQTRTASSQIISIHAVDFDSLGNSIGEHSGFFTVETLQNIPIVYKEDETIVRLSNASPNGGVFVWQPFYVGQFRLNWTAADAPANPTASSGVQTVIHSNPTKLDLSLFEQPAAGSGGTESLLTFAASPSADKVYRPQIKLADEWNNTVDFSGTATLSWSFSNSDLTNPEGFEPLVPSNGSCTFVSGVCNLSTGNDIEFRTATSTTQVSLGVVGTFPSPVAGTFSDSEIFGSHRPIIAGSFDHFLTYPQETESTYRYFPGTMRFAAQTFRSKPDGSNRFSVDICMVDKYGNMIQPATGWTGHPMPISLSLSGVSQTIGVYHNLLGSGTFLSPRSIQAGGFSGASSGILINGVDSSQRPCKEVTNLGYDTWGLFQVIASDGTSSRNTPTNQSSGGKLRTPVVFNPATIDHYNRIDVEMDAMSSGVRVGDRLTFTLKPVDKYNSVVPGLDNYSWTVNAPLPPKNTSSTVDIPSRSMGALATGAVYLYAAGNYVPNPSGGLLGFTLTTNAGGTTLTARPSSSFTLGAGTMAFAQVNATAAEAASTWPADYFHPFTLEVTSTDQYGNAAPGPSSVELVATNPRGVLRQNGTSVATSSLMFQPSAFPSPPAGWEGMTPYWRNTGFRINLNNPQGRWTGDVWYPYGHTVDISAVVGSAAIERTATVRFVPTLATVNGFHILSATNPWDTTNVFVGSSNLDLRILAYSHGQQVYGLDSQLNAVLPSLNWQGKLSGSVEKRGTVYTNTLGTAGNFVDGVSSVVHSIYAAKDYSPLSITLTLSGTSLGANAWSATGRQQSQINVNSGVFQEILVRTDGQGSPYTYPTDQTATPPTISTGLTRSVEANPSDAFGNPVLTGCNASQMLLVPAAAYNSPGGHGGTATAPTITPLNFDPASRTFKGSMTLVKDSLHEFNLTGCPDTRTVKVNVRADIANQIILSTTNDHTTAVHTNTIICPNLAGSISIFDQRLKPDIICPPVYSFAWDAYGNAIGTGSNLNCRLWSFTDLASPSTLFPSGLPNSPSHSATLTSNKFIDGKIKCTATDTFGAPLNGMTAETFVSGGLSLMNVTHSSLAAPLSATDNNISINSISLFNSQSGSHVPWTGNTSDVVRIRVFSQGNPSDIVSTGVDEYQTLTFTGGVYSTPIQLSVKRSGNFTLNVSVRDREYQQNFSVNSLPASTIQLRTASGSTTVTAGVPFTIYASVRDAAGNKTSLPAGSAPNCELTMSGGNSVNTSVHGYAAYNPIIPSSARAQSVQTWDSGWPNYAPWSLTLYAKGTNTITVTGCGLTANFNVNVENSTLDKVTLNTQNDPLTAHMTEKICPNTSSSSAAIACDRVYAFFWDVYGNQYGNSESCDSWQLTAHSSTVPANPAPARSALVSHSTFLDANLVCTKGSTQAGSLLYGGTSRLQFVNDYTTLGKSNITAGLSNFEVSQIKLFQRRNNVEIDKADAAFGIVTLAKSSALSWAQLGQSSTLICNFNSGGECSGSPFQFNFTNAETASLSASIFGLTQTVPVISVIPATVTRTEDVTISGIPTPATAGTQFTLNVSVRDQFGNLTTNGCNQLAISGGDTSPGQHGTTATAPALPANSNQSSVGQYPAGLVTLYKEGTNTLTFSVCGRTVNKTVDVNEAPVFTVLLNNSNTAPANHVPEILCSNHATNNATATVTCGTISPFFYDEYGNSVGDPANSCDTWLVTSRESAGGGTQPATLAARHNQSGAAFYLTHTSWIDSTVVCQKNGSNGVRQASTLIYGGLKDITATVTPAAAPRNITTGNANVSVSSMKLWYQKNGTDYGKADAGFKMLTLTEDSILTTAELGSSDFPTCNFNSSGVCTTPFNFNFTKSESARSLTFSLYGKQLSVVDINVAAGNAALITVDNISAKAAGESFDAVLRVFDAANNPTDAGCGAGVTPTGFSISGGQSSAGGHGGTPTSPVIPNTTTKVSTGVYQISGITLYLKGTNTLIFGACGAAASASKAITVNEAALNTVTLHTADNTANNHASTFRCDHTGTGTDVQCNALYAFFWDAYGNRVGTNTEACDAWSWANRTGAGATGSTPTVSTTASQSKSFTHTSAINGDLTCTKTVSGVTRSVSSNVYGGITSMIISTNIADNGTLDAANDNFTLTSIQLNMKKGNAEVAMENAGTLPIEITTNYTTGVTGLGQTTPKNCAFNSTTGVCTANWTFDFSVAQSGVNLSFRVRNTFLQTRSNLTVQANVASQIQLTAPSSTIAGASFNVTADVKDAYGNYTNRHATSGGTCNSLAIVGASNSPAGNTPSTAAVNAMTSTGRFINFPITLVKEGTEALSIQACGLSQSLNMPVGEDVLQSVRLSTTNNDTSVPAHTITPVYCNFTTANATNNNIACQTIYAYALDAYGNAIGAAANPCTSWTYSPKSGGGSDLTASLAASTSKSQTITHTDFIDADLTCTRGGQSASINLYGGLSNATVTTSTALPATLTAGNNNLSVNSVSLFTRRGGAQIALPAASDGNQTITWTTDAANASNIVFGGSATSTCSFSAGLCNTAKQLSFRTAPESSKQVEMNIRGKIVPMTGITVTPAAAHTLTVSPAIGAQTAGTTFNATILATDSLGNLTANGCGNISTSGGTASPFANAPELPAASAQSSLGTYTASAIRLYRSGSNTLTFSACGLNFNQTVTVNAAAQNSVRISTTDNDASPPAHQTEVFCPFTAGSTTNNVQCPTLYAYNLDAYGNAVAGTNACSSWNWTGQTGSFAAAAPNSAGRSASLSTTNGFIDGTLTCNTGGTSQTIIVYGGIHSLQLPTYTSQPGPVALTAGTGNFSFGILRMYTQKQGTAILFPATADGNQSVGLAVSSGLLLTDLTSTTTPQNCNFASGVCTLPWSTLNFQKATTGKTLTVSVRGVNVSTGSISVSPAAQHHLTITAPVAGSTIVAGTSFNATVEVRDQFENVVTTSNCTSLTPDVNDGGSGVSPNGTTPTVNAAANHTDGVYTLNNLVLVRESSTAPLRFTPAGCGLSPVSLNLQINEAALNSVRLSTTNNDASPPSHQTELYCPLTNASPSNSNAVGCSAIHAYALDGFGNAFGASTSPCDSWSYVTNTGGGSLSPTMTNTAKSQTVSHTDFFDGQLRCTKSGTTASINIYGGISYIDIPSANRTSTASPIIATTDNFSVSKIRAFGRRNGADWALPDGSQQVTVTTSYAGSLAGLGFTSPQQCTFTSGECTASYLFDFSNSASNSSLTFSVRGKQTVISGINVNTPANLSSTSSGSFGTRPTGSSTELTFTFSNDGQTQATLMSGATLSAPFAFTGGTFPGTGGTCGTTLNAGANCTIKVTYSPTSAGSHSASLTLNYHNGLASGQSASVSLSATALTPANLSISDAGYNFGDVVVGTSLTKSFTISNSGGFAATGLTLSGYSDGYTESSKTCSSSLTAGGSCTVIVQFAPASAGAKTFTLSAGYNDANTTQTATRAVTGTGKNPASVTASPSSWAAGTQIAGSVIEQTLIFSNASGTDYVNATALSLNTLDNQFRYKGGTAPGTGGTCGAGTTTLSQGGSCTVVVEYAPTIAQSNSKNLILSYNNGLGVITQSVAMSGTATPAAAQTLTAAQSAAGNVTAGSAFTLSLTVKDQYNNDTDVNCNVNSISVNGGTNAPAGHGNASADTPVRPTTMTKTATGRYTTDSITLFNAEETPSLTVQACGVTSGSVSVTVVPAALANIGLNSSDNEPSDHTPAMTLTEGSTLSGNVFAFGWDAYGNSVPSEANKTTFACTSWTFTNNTSPSAPALSSTGTSHSTTMSQSNHHIDGSLVCAVGGVQATTTVTGKIHQNYTLSCTRTCSGGNPDLIQSASCEIANNGSYSSTFTLNPDSASTVGSLSGNCLTGSGTCTGISVTPNTAVSDLNIGITATEGDSARVNLIDPSAAALACP